MADTVVDASYSYIPGVRAGSIGSLGASFMGGGLAVIFLWFGAMKFTSYEAVAVAEFVGNSRLVGWWHAVLGIQGTSYMLGVYEIATGVLLLAGFVNPRLSAPTLPSGVPSKAKACSNETPAEFQNSAFSFDGSAAMAGTCRVRINRRRKYEHGCRS